VFSDKRKGIWATGNSEVKGLWKAEWRGREKDTTNKYDTPTGYIK
jgi:hypothetical protein